MAPAASESWSGACVLLYAYDIGQGIDLERAAKLMGTEPGREKLRHRIHAPSYFQIQPPPLRIDEPPFEVALPSATSPARVELTVYDFGAVSVSYTLPFAGSLEQWIALGCELQDAEALPNDALERVRRFAAAIGPAVFKYGLSELSEDYLLFQFSAAEHVDELADRHAGDLARLLRAERSRLSDQEVNDALASRVAFSRRDLAFIDWNAALVFDDAAEDISTVLEFANVQLLEMRFLDSQLDSHLERSFETLERRGWSRIARPGPFERDLAGMSRLQVEGAVLFERVGNALKLLNDQYLARAYRLASQRFRLGEWNTSILRKLDTLDGIYQKIQDRADARRMEFLEWIIILLFLLSLALPFVPGYGH
jgi:hypothetical protein